jgi:hypothetical protein
VKEMVVFSAVLVGAGHQVECTVRATKTTLDRDQSVAGFSDFSMMDSDLTDKLPDGKYELLIHGARIQVRRATGHFVGTS